MSKTSYLKAEWKKVSQKRLIEILKDTAENCPDRNYSPFDVYSIAKELYMLREKVKEQRKK